MVVTNSGIGLLPDGTESLPESIQPCNGICCLFYEQGLTEPALRLGHWSVITSR